VLVLLPPSETKASGGDCPPLNLDVLAFPALNLVRAKLVDLLAGLSSDLPAALRALNLSARQADQLAHNAALRSSATMPAIRRYSGVLYDSLGYSTLGRAARARADARLVIGSALFGAVRAGDPIPAYRLSGGSALPGLGTLSALWRPVLVPELVAAGQPLLDLRSGSYSALAPVPGALSVRVLTEHPDGSRTVVSHFNKHHKGVLVRALVNSRAEVSGLAGLLRIARQAGMAAERTGPDSADLIVGG
jgi:cytoplasmic iron level regulating protein YaaA (DUF328/UPF0246 family)